MAKPKLSRKKLPVFLPASLGEVAEFQRKMAEHLRSMEQIENELEGEIAKLATKAAERTAPLQAEILQLARGVLAYAQEHREELTEGGKRKTVTLPHAGHMRWYATPDSISVRDTDEVLKELKRRELMRFIRTTETVDKEALLKEKSVAETVPGINISSRDKFVTVPPDGGTRIEADISTRRWKIVRKEEKK